MTNPIDIEKSVHGESWGEIHEGYFSSPEIARPLADLILNILKSEKCDTVVDLGGGTGFLLSELMSRYNKQNVQWLNLDCSETQLNQSELKRIKCCSGSVDVYKRKDIVPENTNVLWIMRSVLHYFGQEGLSDVLVHLRKQIKTGEYFIHQTASFEDEKDADCLNTIYRLMRTTKWYPTVDALKSTIKETGWHLHKILNAPALPLSSSDLARRYHLTPQDIQNIRQTISSQFDVSENIFRLLPDGFHANLNYKIYICQAV